MTEQEKARIMNLIDPMHGQRAEPADMVLEAAARMVISWMLGGGTGKRTSHEVELANAVRLLPGFYARAAAFLAWGDHIRDESGVQMEVQNNLFMRRTVLAKADKKDTQPVEIHYTAITGITFDGPAHGGNG